VAEDKYKKDIYGKEYVEKNPSVQTIVTAQNSVKRILQSKEWYEHLQQAEKIDVGALSFDAMRKVTGRLEDVFDKKISMSIKDHLKSSGVKFGRKEINSLVENFGFGDKFLGKTLKQRLLKIQKMMQKEISAILADPKILDKVSAVKNFMTGNYWGNNAFRPITRLAVSEFNRIQQETASLIGDSLVEKGKRVRYEWILSQLPGRKYDICDVYAEKRFFNRKTLPRYPHPFCYCEVKVAVV
jgi:hypothetical protein